MASESEYFRKAGQHAVKAELVARGWIPYTMAVEPESGDQDMFVKAPEAFDLTRLRVKSARADEEGDGFGTRFHVEPDALRGLPEPPRQYVFVVRTAEAWGPFVVIGQKRLQRLVVDDGLGYETEEGLRLEMRYERGEGDAVERVQCGDTELTEYMGDFSRWEG